MTTCHDLIDDYCRDRLARGEIVERSARNFRAYLTVWCDFAGPVEQWTGALAAAWVHDQAVRPGTRRNRLNRLRPFAAWCVAHDVLDVDVTADVAPVAVPRPNPRDLPVDAVTRVLAACADERTLLVVLLMVHCALRSVDVSRIRVEDIDAHRRTLAVRAKGGRGEVTHHVPVPAEVWTRLAAWVAGLGRGVGPLIASERRSVPTALSPDRVAKIAYAAVRAAGLKGWAFDGISPHALRHSCAQHMLDGGADIRDVQHALGHRHVTTTEGYLRREPPGLRAAIEGRRYLAAS